jgi:hypothetical protein
MLRTALLPGTNLKVVSEFSCCGSGFVTTQHPAGPLPVGDDIVGRAAPVTATVPKFRVARSGPNRRMLWKTPLPESSRVPRTIERLPPSDVGPEPGFQPPQIELCGVDSKGETLYIMRLGQPENQYFAPDGKPIAKEEAHRLSSASETADLP